MSTALILPIDNPSFVLNVDPKHLLEDFSGGSIGKWVGKRLVYQIPVDESKCNIIMRRGLQVLAIGASCGGPYPYINISRQATTGLFDNLLICGNWASFAALDVWTWHDIIETEMGPRSEEDLALREKPSWCKTAVKVAAFMLGITAQVPLADIAAVYNPSNRILNVALTIAADSGPTLKSIYSTLDEIRKRRSVSKDETPFLPLKERLIGMVEHNRAALIEIGLEERVGYLRELSSLIDNGATKPEQLQQALRLLLTPLKPRAQTTESCSAKGLRYVATAGGLALSAAKLGMIAVTSFQATKFLTDSDLACGVSAGVITLVNTYFTVDVLTKVAKETTRKVAGLFQCKVDPSLSLYLRPKLTLASNLLLIGCFAAFSWGPSYEVGHSYFSHDYAKILMEMSLSLGTVMMVSFALNALVDDVILKCVGSWGVDEERALIKISQQMYQLNNMIRNSPILEFAQFTKAIPSDILESALEDLDLTSERIDAFIDSKIGRERLIQLTGLIPSRGINVPNLL